MKKATAALSAIMLSLMVATAGFAGEGNNGSNTADYKAVPKAMHEYAFPTGHPATKSWLNHCYWVEEENLYFCKDNKWQ